MSNSSSSIADVDRQNGPDLLLTGRDSNGDRVATLYLQQPDGSFQPASAGASPAYASVPPPSPTSTGKAAPTFSSPAPVRRRSTSSSPMARFSLPARASLACTTVLPPSPTSMDRTDPTSLSPARIRISIQLLYLQQAEPAGAGLTGVSNGSPPSPTLTGRTGPTSLSPGGRAGDALPPAAGWLVSACQRGPRRRFI